MADITNTAPGQELPAGKPSQREQESLGALNWEAFRPSQKSAGSEASAAYDYEYGAPAADWRLYMALGGAALLVIGTFLPLFTVSVGSESESINYYGNGRGDGWFILAFAGIAAVAALARRYMGPLFVGVAALALMIWDMISVFSRSSEVSSLGGSLGMGWAWLVLIPGAILLIWSPGAPHSDGYY